MGIRTELKEGRFVEWREERWTFGARVKILEAGSDLEALDLIVPFVSAWNICDVDGKAIPFDKGGEALLNVEDELVTAIIRAWFEAREKRRSVPKAS